VFNYIAPMDGMQRRALEMAGSVQVSSSIPPKNWPMASVGSVINNALQSPSVGVPHLKRLSV